MNRNKYLVCVCLSGLGVWLQARPVETAPRDTAAWPGTGYAALVSDPSGSLAAGSAGAAAFEYAADIDMGKALYGKIAGLNVTPGTGSSASNLAVLTLHGHTPLVLVDGYPRDMQDLTWSEIESVTVLKDAAAAAIYGMRGANGVVAVKTRRGRNQPLRVTARYQLGVNTQFRSPEFAGAYTYAQCLNAALAADGLAPRYGIQEQEAFKNGTYPDEFPDVDWWKESLRSTGINHRLDLTFTGGGPKFRYFAAVEYYRDRSMLESNAADSRYDTKPTDTRLNLRTNLDVNMTESTRMHLGVVGKLQEINGSNGSDIFQALYRTPAAAFPVKYADGTYGGNSVYGDRNPVGMLVDRGHRRQASGLLLADLNLEQRLDGLTEGLLAEASVAFDNSGWMYEETSKEYRYLDTQGSILSDGTLVTHPLWYGKDSETVGHSQGFQSLYMRSDFRVRLAYDRLFGGKHRVAADAVFEQQALTRNGRNRGTKNQSLTADVAYSYAGKYFFNGVFSRSGSAYLPRGDKFRHYPAVSAAWLVTGEDFMKKVSFIDWLKLRVSYGLSGWDGNMSHELWRQSYGGNYAGGYYFGKNIAEAWGQAEGPLPVENLTAERSERFTFGFDLQAFRGRFAFSADAFRERRSDVLVSGTNSVSSLIGIDLRQQCAGVYLYRGVDLALSWNDRKGAWRYGLAATMSYLGSEVVNENQAYQEYAYLYHRGNRVGQCYGLEAIGFFADRMDINNSPVQTFSQVRPGDIKYKDQNGDNRIDEKDVVRMFGSTSPRCYFGLSLQAAWKGVEVAADFQGMTGVTTSLLGSPLYKPLVDNGTISDTFLKNEVPWTPENRQAATMPRLTTQPNANNYRDNSLWYRDASYLKLRSLVVAYTFPRSVVRFADMKLFAQGTNLFSLDNIGFADPEQLSAAYPSVRTYWAGVRFDF